MTDLFQLREVLRNRREHRRVFEREAIDIGDRDAAIAFNSEGAALDAALLDIEILLKQRAEEEAAIADLAPRRQRDRQARR